MQKTTDVAIVGGGVIGSSISYYLAKRGIRSVVFEQHSLASGASGATAGLITPLWHVDHANDALFDMGIKSLNAYPGLAADLAESGADPGLWQCGVLKVAITQEEIETLKDDFAWQGELGLGVAWLGADEVFEREPELSRAGTSSGSTTPASLAPSWSARPGSASSSAPSNRTTSPASVPSFRLRMRHPQVVAVRP